MEETDGARRFLADYPVAVEFPLAWGEMDSFGHVNNVIYFRYFESARIACFDRIGYPGMMEESGVGPILAATECRFRIPLTYPDELITGTAIGSIGEDEFEMDYAVFSRRKDSVAARGSGRIVSFDYRRQARVPIPGAIRDGLERLLRGR
ncbi:MAG: thioesterase family protein [Gammaproteobacteria bacterium]|jgi:acyl-CoA thioester hydrolase